MANHHDHNAPGHPPEHHHGGHVIIAPSTLLGVLVALLALTGLTVGLAQLETLLMQSFNIVLPQWVNVFVALSIAALKTTLVVLYFMQLRYDNPLNTLVFIFTMITVCFFLGFTMTDIGTRRSIDRIEGEYTVAGGTGLDGTGTPITVRAAQAASNPDHPLHHAWLKAHGHGEGGHETKRNVGFPLPAGAFEGSSAWQSRPVTGLTLPGFAPEGDHGDGHGHGRGGH